MRRSRRISYLTQSYETNSGQEKGEFCCGGPPPHPPSRASPLQPFTVLHASNVLACSRLSLLRYYSHTEQVRPNSEHLQAVGQGSLIL